MLGVKSVRRVPDLCGGIYNFMVSGIICYTKYFRVYYPRKRNKGILYRKAIITLCTKLTGVISILSIVDSSTLFLDS